jgi:hypothetical protein
MEALARVQRLEKRQGMVGSIERFGTAFKTLLALGSTMTDVSVEQDPVRLPSVTGLSFSSWTLLEVPKWRLRFALRLGRYVLMITRLVEASH